MPKKSKKSTARLLRVFLCHSSADKAIVREINLKLQSEGWIAPWLDEEKILPGQDWDLEIRKAVDETDAVIVFLSKGSVAKEGYLQKEFKSIVEEALEKPENTIFILPLRIQVCKIPTSLQKIHYIDYFPENERRAAYGRVIQALKQRADSLGIEATKTTTRRANYSIKVGPQKKKQTNSRSRFQLRIIDSEKISENLLTSDGHSVYTYGNIQFVQVSAGPFIMGSRIDNTFSHSDERPQLTIDIPYDYFIGRYPVTISQYEDYIDWRGFEHEWDDDMREKSDHPITCVTWDRARDFCRWLNEEHADELPIRSDMKLIFRLPTEAEWEKAARGEKDWSWPWGDKFGKEKCNSIEGGILTTTRVGQYSPKGGDSPYGAADMVGNVWEWTNTRYARYPYKSGDGREKNQGKGQSCVVRGGCYRDSQKYARITYRYPILDASLYYFQGFRVVVAPPVSSIR